MRMISEPVTRLLGQNIQHQITSQIEKYGHYLSRSSQIICCQFYSRLIIMHTYFFFLLISLYCYVFLQLFPIAVSKRIYWLWPVGSGASLRYHCKLLVVLPRLKSSALCCPGIQHSKNLGTPGRDHILAIGWRALDKLGWVNV